MAVLRDTPKTICITNNHEFLNQIQSSGEPYFREPVRKGTYPRSGFEHPRLAVGDCIEFVTKKRGLTLFDSGSVFEVTGISLGRLPKCLDWDWIVDLKRKDELV